MSDHAKVVIKVEGGIADVALVEGTVDIHIIDYDVEGEDDSRLCNCDIAGADAKHLHIRTGGR